LTTVYHPLSLCTEEDDEEEDLSEKMYMPEGGDIIFTFAQKQFEQNLLRFPPSKRVQQKNGINGRLHERIRRFSAWTVDLKTALVSLVLKSQ
jgi:hypothetical protein